MTEECVILDPEERARQNIDKHLVKAGWSVQDKDKLNLGASLGVVVRDFAVKSGEVDYLLFVDRKAVGVLEAKAEGITLSGVAEQTERYLHSIPDTIPHFIKPLPFAYESTGVETYFRDGRDPEPRSRPIFSFHSPEILEEWIKQGSSIRNKLRHFPELKKEGLRECQFTAIKNLEESFGENKPRALIQMATGSGKTYMAVSSVYRLLKFANAKRVLFLVDRNNLGRQTLNEFQQFVTPDDGRKFTELYNIQRLTSNSIDPVSKVCITTIQRLYSILKGEPDFDSELEEQSLHNIYMAGEKEREVTYNPSVPIETFDFIITDECHRSIYHVWRQVLEYFDAYIIGLTATPSKQTLGFFSQNLVMEYPHERAVADGVNVGYEVYRIRTKITEGGSVVEAGNYVDKRDKLTRAKRWEMLDEDLEYAPVQLDKDIVASDQIRTVIRTFKERLFTEIFPGRSDVPKTLIFAKDDSHAEDIVHIVREEFGRGNEFCKKITYRTTGEKPEDLIASFRNSYNPRIAVTVDMISTGTDIKPLECLLFMRIIKSSSYFEQMKGRGTRTISSTDFQAVTRDAKHKDHFVIIDAVGVCEIDKTDSRPLEKKKSITFEALITSIAMGNRDKDALNSLAGRLASIDRKMDEKDGRDVERVSGDKTIRQVINHILDAVDPDKQIERAKETYNNPLPTPEQIKKTTDEMAKEACIVFDKPELRNLLIDIKKRNEQTIDTVSKDSVLFAGSDENAKEKARGIVNTFKQFIEENKDEITALQIIYNKPYGQKHLTHDTIKDLADAIHKPPYNLTPELIWSAYERLEKSKVKGVGPQKLLADIISILRFTVGETDVLQPFTDTVDDRFQQWLERQDKSGRKFTAEQMDWLVMIKNHIATTLEIKIDDFDLTPFNQKGGRIRVYQLFGKELEIILNNLVEALVA